MTRVAPGKLDLADVQDTFRQAWSVIDAKPGLDLSGASLDNSGDAVTQRGLVNRSQLLSILEKYRKPAREPLDISSAILENLFDMQLEVQTSNLVIAGVSALTDVPGMSFPVRAGESWVWLGLLAYAANATAGFGLTYSGAVNPGYEFVIFSYGFNTTVNAFFNFGSVQTMPLYAAGRTSNIMGTILNTTTDGTIQLQAQGLGAGTLTLYKNSWIAAFRVG